MPNSHVRIVFNDLPRLIREYPEKVADGIEATAREGERYVKESIASSPASGRTYGSHTASSPGNPPRIDTSNLVNSINSKKIHDHLWAILVGAPYGPDQEFGTRHMAPRPYMGPMAIWLEKQIEDIVKGYLD